MPTNLTGTTIASTFDQLLHVDDGPAATEKTVYSGTGVATALKVGTLSASVDNIQLDGNTIATTNTDGNLVLAPNGTGAVTTDNLSLSGNAITVTDTDGNLVLSGNGTGSVAIAKAAITDGSISGVTFSGSFTGLTLVESTTLATGDVAAGVNLNGNTLAADGTDADIDINITPKGAGEVVIAKPFGYGGAGVGGTVTQLTSKSTGVTLNKVSGQITTDNEKLNRNTGVSFTLTNSYIDATDVVYACISSGATLTAYVLGVTVISAGACSFHLHNLLNGTDLSEALTINFVVIKAVAA